ncbi:hypothetical protein [Deferrisoma camini]|uniref:hypothetical protein n=1 Tax=Deferrisoma camini TaxID=1035120 RepID=UPI00046D4EBC|nr:hypothetical protein [Deferrisoma camini]
MPDGVRMMDLAALTRGLEEFKRLDPEQRVLANRLATQAAVHRVEEVHRDVTAANRAGETRVRDRDRRSDSEGEGQRHAGAEEGEDAEVESCPPEADEGHVLDIKV